MLTPGTKLGPYEIVSPLGAGGMGEVYRARDTRLGRDVAIKVLPQHLSSNPEIRARFEREARTVSSLNHPYICTLHDIGREGSTDYLVMELVDGETLATRIARGALPPAEVLRIGAQVSDALDRAHRAGVVHRDLKPGNIMLTKGGVKLMDFGLARATGMVGTTSGSMTAMTQSPTMAQPLTAEGTIVGTFQYMSPEQLEGKETDARGDIWALGCVLYEMATGARAFEGSNQASLISSIMRDQPRAMSELVPMAPPALDRVVSLCLAKDPDDRYQSAHDVRLALDMIRDSSGTTAAGAAVLARPKRSTASLLWLVGGIVIGAALGFGASRWFTPAPQVSPARVSTLVNSGADQQPVASPDGKTVAFASARTGKSRIWIKQLASSDEVALTDGEDSQPQFSPDGSQILYAHSDPDGSSLWRVSIVGGQPRRLVENAVEGAWSPDGKQLGFLRLSDNLKQGEVWLANADGSGARRVHANESSLRWLSWSPNGDRMMTATIPLANAAVYYLMIPTNGDSVKTVSPMAGLSLTSNPVWLGSGDRIAYAIVEARATSSTGQASRIVEQSLRTGKVRELLSLPSSVLNLAVIGNGQLLFGINQSSQSLVLVDHPGTADGARALAHARGQHRPPAHVFSRWKTRALFEQPQRQSRPVGDGRRNRRAVAHHRSSRQRLGPRLHARRTQHSVELGSQRRVRDMGSGRGWDGCAPDFERWSRRRESRHDTRWAMGAVPLGPARARGRVQDASGRIGSHVARKRCEPARVIARRRFVLGAVRDRTANRPRPRRLSHE
jgi:serine/threonine protein kinase